MRINNVFGTIIALLFASHQVPYSSIKFHIAPSSSTDVLHFGYAAMNVLFVRVSISAGSNQSGYSLLLIKNYTAMNVLCIRVSISAGSNRTGRLKSP
jgi:hypothetical protein